MLAVRLSVTFADRRGAVLSNCNPGHGLVILTAPNGFTRLILDTAVRGRRELRRLACLALPAPGGSATSFGRTRGKAGLELPPGARDIGALQGIREFTPCTIRSSPAISRAH